MKKGIRKIYEVQSVRDGEVPLLYIHDEVQNDAAECCDVRDIHGYKNMIELSRIAADDGDDILHRGDHHDNVLNSFQADSLPFSMLYAFFCTFFQTLTEDSIMIHNS